MTYLEPEPIQLRYPVWVRLLAASLVAAPIGAASLIWGQETPAEEWQSIIPYTVLGVWLALTYQVFLVEVYYDERGLTYVSPMAGVVRVRWPEIVALYYVRSLDGYVVEAEDGRRIWFQQWRSGIGEVADAIQSRLPRQARGGQ